MKNTHTHAPLRAAAWLACAAALASAAAPALAADPHAKHGKHWSYAGHTSPANWATLDPEFSGCKLGKAQSPIDIPSAKAKPAADLPALGFDYTAGPAELVNNGHTIQLNLSAGGSFKTASGEYKLLQFHFHTPSEERINGQAFPMVAHLVHKNDAGQLAVVAVLLRQGKTNEALAPLFDALPAKEGGKLEVASFDTAKLLPSDRHYFAYTGSLTTPPCSEGVAWHVLQKPVTLSSKQLAQFRKLYRMNARPVQPLNGREVKSAGG